MKFICHPLKLQNQTKNDATTVISPSTRTEADEEESLQELLNSARNYTQTTLYTVVFGLVKTGLMNICLIEYNFAASQTSKVFLVNLSELVNTGSQVFDIVNTGCSSVRLDLIIQSNRPLLTCSYLDRQQMTHHHSSFGLQICRTPMGGRSSIFYMQVRKMTLSGNIPQT